MIGGEEIWNEVYKSDNNFFGEEHCSLPFFVLIISSQTAK